MTIETGALEQAYADLEASYNPVAVAALASTDAIRILELVLSGKTNREPSPEKRGTPDEAQSLPRRFSAQWNLSSIMWEPSGVLGTESNVAKLIKAGMGTQHAATLTTTVNAAPAPTATSCTLISATGLAVGDIILLQVAGFLQATRVKTLVGLAITFDALSAAPTSPGVAIAGITFGLSSNIVDSFAIYKYYNAGNFKQACYGSVVDQITVKFDGTKEVQLAFQGPAADYQDSSTGGGTVQAKPGAHTTVGSPAGGMVGSFYVDGNSFLVIAATLNINNNLELRNKELGTQFASAIAGRQNLRKVKVTITAFLEDLRLLGMAHSIQKGVLRLLIGDTSGSMLAMVCPSVEFEVPEVGNEIGPKEITFEGTAYAVTGNDQVFLAEA